MNRVIIIGAGGHGRVVADVIQAMQAAGDPVQVAGLLDADSALHGTRVLDYPVLGGDEDLSAIEHNAVILAIGNNFVRKTVFNKLTAKGERFFTARHPAATVSKHARIGAGCVIAARAVVNPAAVVGANVILNTGCVVEHDNIIGNHVHVAPGAVLGGDVRVGEGALIGIGSTVMPQQSVGAWATVGAGACITRPVPDQAVAVGIPARIR